MSQSKILFVAEGVTLAHVGRSLRLATVLHAEGFNVELACDSRYSEFLADHEFPVHFIRSISTREFLDSLAKGRPVYSAEKLTEYVSEDLSLLKKTGPDVVIGDFRLSLSVSARVAGVPYVNVTNAYWSPYARPRYRMPSNPVVDIVGVTVANALFSVVRPLAFAAHSLPMNRVLRAYGLKALAPDVRAVYCDGDLTLYADIPEIIPIFGNPPSHRHIGPVLWSPPVGLPPWWEEAMAEKPPIYVSLGSSGPAQRLPIVIEGLASLGRAVVVARAGHRVGLPRRERLWVADFLPGEAIAAKACAVVCNGGSPTSQQALVHGVPVIGIASNLDQYLNMDYVERFGAGTLMRADRVSATAVRDAAERAIGDEEMRCRACAAAAMARATRPEVQFVSAIQLLLDEAKQTVAKLTV